MDSFRVVVRREVKRTLTINISGRKSCQGTYQVLIASSQGSISVYPSSDLSEEEPTRGRCSLTQTIGSPEFALFGDGQRVLLIWNDSGVFTQFESRIEGGSLTFAAECPYRVQAYGEVFACSTEDSANYSRPNVAGGAQFADLRFQVCDYPYPLMDGDKLCTADCAEGQIMVLKDKRFACVDSCAAINPSYAISAMHSAGSGLKYATCKVCNAIREIKDGQVWCINRCRPSKGARDVLATQGAAGVEAVDRALLSINNVSWCIDPREYADSECKYLYNK